MSLFILFGLPVALMLGLPLYYAGMRAEKCRGGRGWPMMRCLLSAPLIWAILPFSGSFGSDHLTISFWANVLREDIRPIMTFSSPILLTAIWLPFLAHSTLLKGMFLTKKEEYREKL